MDWDSYERFSNSWWPYFIAIFIGIVSFIRSYVGGQECPSQNNIKEKTVLITGGSSGLGLQVAKELAKRGGIIILTCRDLTKGNSAKEIILKENANARIDLRYLDVSNLKCIEIFAKNLKEYDTIDILINNVGIMFHPYQITDEGFETHFVTNYLGHFALTHLLLPKLKASQNGRIINVAAQAYSSGSINFNDINLNNAGSNNIVQAFSQSKLAIVLMTRYMSKLLKGTNVTVNSVDPGLIRNTNHMSRSPLKASIPVKLSVWPWMWLFLKTVKQGSQTIVYLAVEPNLSKTTGKHFSNCEIKELSDNCKDETVDEELYKISYTLTTAKINLPELK